MERFGLLALLGTLIVSAPAYAQDIQFGKIKVYTRNLYVGTDFGTVLQAPDLVSAAQLAFNEIVDTNFPQRAETLAEDIKAIRPHLIGLQEVFNFKLNEENRDLPFIDYLSILLTALAARGLDYQVAAVVNNIDLTFEFDLNPSLPGDEVLQVTDRDVILARGDVPTTVVAFPCSQLLDNPNDDGCNYATLLPLDLPNPFSDTFLFHGFVGVDAEVDGQTFRFVNTHLELQRAADQDISFIQQAQAAELVDTIAAATPPQRPVILVGDFNSAPMDPAGSAYDIIHSAGYADTWKQNLFKFLNPDGFTCCQSHDLDNDESRLDKRIDIVFVKNNLGLLPFSFTGPVTSVVIGDEPISDTQPKWSSDHAGPFAVLHRIPVFERDGGSLLADRSEVESNLLRK